MTPAAQLAIMSALLITLGLSTLFVLTAGLYLFVRWLYRFLGDLRHHRFMVRESRGVVLCGTCKGRMMHTDEWCSRCRGNVEPGREPPARVVEVSA